MKEKFISWSPSKISSDLLEKIDSVIISYDEQGYKLTLRQLYYQLITHDLLPTEWADEDTGSTNNDKSYKRLGNIISQGRLAGLIDWDMIEDRNKNVSKNNHWSNPRDILDAAADQFYSSRWVNQDNYLFVMVEKDAVSNVIEPVCRQYDVSFLANKGYSSLSALYELYRKLAEKFSQGKNIYCIYVGDFDPSGLDMDRDLKDRLELFLGKNLNINRVALTMPQIKQYNPPENPAKVTDSRFQKYQEKHGEFSWELDALEPSILKNIVEESIVEHIDMQEFKRISVKEKGIKEQIKKFASKWSDSNL